MSDATKLAIEALEEALYHGNQAFTDKVTVALAALRAQPADPFKKLSDAQVLWLAQSHGIDVYASNPLAFYADLISTTPAQPDHSELVAKLQDLVDNGWIEGCKTTTRDIEEAILALT